jgi:MFS transporter, MHS family, proline/betaine transporter
MNVSALLAISQLFPTGVRVTAGALACNVSQSVFGGTGPLVGVWLNQRTGGPYGLGVYRVPPAAVTAVTAYLAQRVFDPDHRRDPVTVAAATVESR